MKKRGRKHRIASLIVVVFLIAGLVVLWKPHLVPKAIDAVKARISGTDTIVGYHAKSLIVENRESGDIFISKNETDALLPASLAKLYVIDYATTLCERDEQVVADESALAMVKPNSSVADIEVNASYSVEDIYAAMLVPSGNDAAYVLADYLGGKLNPEAGTAEQRVQVFLTGLKSYLAEQGYANTVINDPSGYDYDSTTTVLELEKVSSKLLTYQWFRDIVSQYTYTATLADDRSQVWMNTNVFLDPQSEFYNPNVVGIKTGSLADDYNLVVLYQQHGKEFLICSIGSESNTSRYDDVTYLLQTIDQSTSLE